MNVQMTVTFEIPDVPSKQVTYKELIDNVTRGIIELVEDNCGSRISIIGEVE